MVSGCDSDVRPAAHSPRSSPNVSPSHSYSATSVGSVGSSSSSATNGFVTNGTCMDNGFEADNMPMEVEDFEESSSNGVLNGTAKMDESDHSPSRGNLLFVYNRIVISHSLTGTKLHFDTSSVLVENRPLTKFIQHCTWDPSPTNSEN